MTYWEKNESRSIGIFDRIMGKRLEYDRLYSRAQSRKKNFFFLSKIFKVLDLIRSRMWLRAEFRSGRNDSAF